MTRFDQPEDVGGTDERPAGKVPLFGTWRRAYAVAIALFGVEIALLYAFTHYFS